MDLRELSLLTLSLLMATGTVLSADWYVSPRGKNKNPGTSPAAPLKNIRKALDKAAPGDTVKVAGGNYYGVMGSGNILMKTPVKLLGGFSPDFAARDILKYKTRVQPNNQSNGTGCNHSLLRIMTRKGPILIDGLLFDKGEVYNYSLQKGIVEGVEGVCCFTRRARPRAVLSPTPTNP